MDILNYILLAALALFLIAMTLICLGMFLKSKDKNEDEMDFSMYYEPTVSKSGRHLGETRSVVSTKDEEPNDSDEDPDDENVVDEKENQDDDIENDLIKDKETSDVSELNSEINPDVQDKANDKVNNEDDVKTYEPKSNNKVEKQKSENAEKPKAVSKDKKGSGMEITVTIIDSNKKKNVTVVDEILIGRNKDCDVIVNKPMVSSLHCVLIREGKKLMVEDNNSTNGTMLNGKPLKYVVEVKNNDVLTLGDQSIRINLI